MHKKTARLSFELFFTQICLFYVNQKLFICLLKFKFEMKNSKTIQRSNFSRLCVQDAKFKLNTAFINI
jgi:hypothetical protein